jgi:putative flippase GtrA
MQKMMNFILEHSIAKFILVGGASTGLQLMVLILIVEIAGANPIVASALSYACGAVCNYLMNYYFTFSSTSNHAQTLPKFVCVVLIGMSVNTATFSLIFQLINLYLIAQFGAIFVTLVINYALHKHWIYREV